jgi:octopine/nopaline transport system substrate-binding protein
MKLIQRFITGATLTAFALAAGTAMAQGKKIKLATEGAYAPWNFTTPQGKLDGFEIDLGAELCKRAKLECEFVAQDWDGIIPALVAQKYDVIMAGMNITDKRKETISFSSVYAAGAHGFLAMKNTKFGSMPGGEFNLTKDPAGAGKAIEAVKTALKGKVVGVQVSTTNSAFVDKYLKDAAEVREYKTTEQHDLDLAAGRIDVAVVAHSAAKATMDTPGGKDMTIVGPGLSGGLLGEGVALGLRKSDTALQTAFNKAIAEAIADGTVKNLSMKWFKVDLSPK